MNGERNGEEGAWLGHAGICEICVRVNHHLPYDQCVGSFFSLSNLNWLCFPTSFFLSRWLVYFYGLSSAIFLCLKEKIDLYTNH